MQISGQKRWKVYMAPFTDPISKASNFFGSKAQQEKYEDIKQTAVLDTVLFPGDVLYIPQGFFHEGFAYGEQELGKSASKVSDDAFGSSSVHITFAPELSSMAEFLSKTPFIRASGMPEFPGANGGYRPVTPEEKEATQGLAPAFRRCVPPRLSRACGTKAFATMLADTLLWLSPKTPTLQARKDMRKLLKERLEGAPLPKPPGTTGIQGQCVQYLYTVVLPELLSLETMESSQAEAETLQLDSQLSLSTSLGARVAVGDSPNGPSGRLRYTTLSGPANRDNFEAITPKEIMVPAELALALATILHSELNVNASAYFTPRAFAPAPGQEAAALDMAKTLLKLRVVQRAEVAGTERRPRAHAADEL